MKLHLQSDQGVTLIENSFIDRYMPAANGEFVKLYLYLLRCAGTGRELTVSSIADFFDHTEKDVRRALSYWEKLDVLKLSYDSKGTISDIVFCLPDEEAPVQGSSAAQSDDDLSVRAAVSEQAADPGSHSVPGKRELTAARKRELKTHDDIRQLIFLEETYLGRPLTPAETGNIMYFYDTLGMSVDLIEYLLEYCASKGNPGARYMEKVAVGWYHDGITTVREAKASSDLYQKDYYDILASLGIKGRAPVSREIEYMDKWMRTWSFSMELIREACARTVLQAAKPSIHYANSILKSWYESGVHSMADIQTLDQARNSSLRSLPLKAPAANRIAGRIMQPNFFQREYDYTELEHKLLSAQGMKGD